MKSPVWNRWVSCNVILITLLTGHVAADFAGDSIAALDQDKDGTVAVEEYVAWQVKNLDRHERDKVAGLSLDEFAQSLDERTRSSAPTLFNNSDRNTDGVLEATEFGGYHGWIFNNILDSNRDGAWTADEYRDFLAKNPGAGPAQQARAMIARLDRRDQNGSVSLQEYLDVQAPKFRTFDTSGNGSFSKAEFKASLEGNAQRRAAASFKRFDFDGDRRLNRQEFFDYHGRIFNNVLDLNRDGEWSVQELESFLK